MSKCNEGSLSVAINLMNFTLGSLIEILYIYIYMCVCVCVCVCVCIKQEHDGGRKLGVVMFASVLKVQFKFLFIKLLWNTIHRHEMTGDADIERSVSSLSE